MDSNKETTSPETDEVIQTPPTPQRGGGENKSFGPLIGIVIIILILVLGGLYLWSNQSDLGSLSPNEDGVIQALQEQGASDEVSAIEEDLSATDLESLDADLKNIEEGLGL
jgi:hypothetical protein